MKSIIDVNHPAGVVDIDLSFVGNSSNVLMGFNFQIADYNRWSFIYLNIYKYSVNFNFLFGHGDRVENVFDDFYEFLHLASFRIYVLSNVDPFLVTHNAV